MRQKLGNKSEIVIVFSKKGSYYCFYDAAGTSPVQRGVLKFKQSTPDFYVEANV